jgi:hypothetical protein
MSGRVHVAVHDGARRGDAPAVTQNEWLAARVNGRLSRLVERCCGSGSPDGPLLWQHSTQHFTWTADLDRLCLLLSLATVGFTSGLLFCSLLQLSNQPAANRVSHTHNTMSALLLRQLLQPACLSCCSAATAAVAAPAAVRSQQHLQSQHQQRRWASSTSSSSSSQEQMSPSGGMQLVSGVVRLLPHRADTPTRCWHPTTLLLAAAAHRRRLSSSSTWTRCATSSRGPCRRRTTRRCWRG